MKLDRVQIEQRCCHADQREGETTVFRIHGLWKISRSISSTIIPPIPALMT